MSSSGYSGTPLAKKLGIKEGFKIKIVAAPEYYFSLFETFPDSVEILDDCNNTSKDLIHFFTKEAIDLHEQLPLLQNEIVSNGSIWVSWPKKASKIATDITEDVIRSLALSIGLVDVKVCAVDAVWSGLKLVIPIKLRQK